MILLDLLYLTKREINVMKKFFIIYGAIVALSISFSCLAATTFIFPVQNPSSVTACPDSPSHLASNFCPGFYTAVMCNCDEHFPAGYCEGSLHVQGIYNKMIAMYGSLATACQKNDPAAPQECIDQWNCYLNGGKDAAGRNCQGQAAPPPPCPEN